MKISHSVSSSPCFIDSTGGREFASRIEFSGSFCPDSGKVEAFCDGKLPRFLIRDRDGVYGLTFRERVKAHGIEEVIIAPHSPWQTPYVERVIGTLRRECLDHVVVIGEAHPRRIMRRYLRYYHETRSHLALEKDAPAPRPVQPPERGKVIEIPEAGGLHHRYERCAA